MKNPSKSNLPAKLAHGRRCFEKWRRAHKPPTRLPAHLWSLAAQLAREYGLNRTARTLRLEEKPNVHRGHRLLMVQHRSRGRAFWVLPGGGVDDGERPRDAGIRELREECHVEGTIIRLVDIKDLFSVNIQNGVIEKRREEKIFA